MSTTEIVHAVADMKQTLQQRYTVKRAEGVIGAEPMIITSGWKDRHTLGGEVHQYLRTEYFQASWPVVAYEQITVGDQAVSLGLIPCNLPIHGNLFETGQFVLVKPKEPGGDMQILRISNVIEHGPGDYHMTFALPRLIQTQTLLGEDGPDLGGSGEIPTDRISFIVAVD